MTERMVTGETVERFLTSSSTVAVARFRADGSVRGANPRFRSLLPQAAAADAALADLVVEGQRDEIAAALAGTGEPPPLVRLARADDEPVTLHATWVREDGDLVLFGEAPVAELEASRAALARLDSQVASLTRENAKKIAQLEAALAELRAEHEELVEARERIELLSREDPLTGVANRRRLEEFLSYELERAARHATPLAVVLVDLDEFHEVNDVYGHTAGDDVLRSAARCLRAGARGTDMVGRWGGEQFLLVLPSTDAAQARVLAERLLAALRAMPIAFRSRPVTGSFGVTDWRRVDSLDTLVSRADEALHDAKRRGRDQVRVR